MRIDLHTHSNASDGTDTPAQVVAAAKTAGLDVVALTDHDTVAGWDEAADAAAEAGVVLVRGAEFSCVWNGGTEPISLHLLGYLFDPDHDAIKAEQERLRDNRLHRGERIVDNLIADGFPITWGQVRAIAGDGAVGRPHIARALIDAGTVADVKQAFDAYLHNGSKYHVPKANTDVFTALEMIKAAGGVAVFAHPLARTRGPVVPDAAIEALAGAGLHGVEVDHPNHAEADRAHLRDLAGHLGLLTTGSSDYHGTNKPTPIGACTTDPRQYERLLARTVRPAS